MGRIGRLTATLAATGIACLLCVPAHANVMYNDFDTGSYSGNSGLAINSSASPAMQFSPTSTGAVSEIDLAVTNDTGTRGVIVSLFTVNGSNAPGTQLGSWTITGLPYEIGKQPVQSITGISGIVLTAGTKYYLQVGPDGTSSDTWMDNTLGISGTIYENGVTHDTFGAFQVLGEPVPEPAAWSTLAIGMAGLAACRRRHGGRRVKA